MTHIFFATLFTDDGNGGKLGVSGQYAQNFLMTDKQETVKVKMGCDGKIVEVPNLPPPVATLLPASTAVAPDPNPIPYVTREETNDSGISGSRPRGGKTTTKRDPELR